MEKPGFGVLRLGKILFCLGLCGLGALSLIFDDFAMVWQPVPAWVPRRELLAYMSGALLLAGGVGALYKRTSTLAALVLAAFVLSWLLLLQIPRVASEPSNEGMWLGFGENLLLLSGGWVLFVSGAIDEGRDWGLFASGANGILVGRYMLGVALPVIGLSHFAYSAGTASMVPAWLPERLFLAYLTGSGHIAAGIGILLGILPGLAAFLEASMITLFVLLLHLPGIVSQPHDRLQWTMFFVASAYAGAAWAVAGSLRGAGRKLAST